VPQILTYHPAPFGAVMHRLDCAAPDPADEGRRLAAVMRDVPPGSRAVLCNDLGGGRSPDERHMWTRADGRPLTREQAQQVYQTGARAGALDAVDAWFMECAVHYHDAGGPYLDFLACNSEKKPDLDMEHAGTFEDVVRWLRLVDGPKDFHKDAIQGWAAGTSMTIIGNTIRAMPSILRVNLGACDFHGPRRDHNGQLFGDSAPCGVSAPFLYLTETVTPNITPDSVLCHNIETWRSVKAPKVAVLGPPHWGGEDVAKVPGCTRRRFTFTGGESRDFYQKDLKVWFPRWEALAREVAKDAVAIVGWWNQYPHGIAPSAAELAAMGKVLLEVSR
jgi:hypothetical protein